MSFPLITAIINTHKTQEEKTQEKVAPSPATKSLAELYLKNDDVFVTEDSGKRVEFESGMVRDTQEGKARYDLIETSYLKRWAELMGRGADKYGEDNWRLANSEQEMKRFKASAFRHFMSWLDGDLREDHGAAVAFNIAAADWLKEKLANPKS